MVVRAFIFGFWTLFCFELAATVVIHEGKDFYELGLHMETLKDSSGKLTIDELSGSEWKNKFKKSKEKILNFE
ncbi:hypothetical protein OAK75_13155 [Bacteriovoracales bacterium]|nr:hypothetical protein [Bacteriovoracales bacterium]